jgi:hypothetical protein
MKEAGSGVPTTNANTLERWRPRPHVYFHCSIAIVLVGGACFWGIARLVARCCQPESPVKTAIAGVVLFVFVLWSSLRRCSTPELPASRGLLLITAYMSIGMGTFSLLLVIPAVAFATVAIIAIALVSLFRNDTPHARKQFRQLVEFYRKHRMYQ